MIKPLFFFFQTFDLHIFCPFIQIRRDTVSEENVWGKKEGKTVSREYHERGLTQSSERKLSPKNLKTGQSGEVETCYSVSISTQFQIAVKNIFLKSTFIKMVILLP